MAKITINPADVIDYKTPLYKDDREAKKVYRLLPETTADQVALASGGNVETKIASMDTQITAAKMQADKGVADAATAQTAANTAQGTANTALNNANSAINNANQAIADAVQANLTANSALSSANTANTNANTALTKANQAIAAAVPMTGATASDAGTQGLVPAPAAGNQGKYLRGDGTWQTPPGSYGLATSTQNGLMSSTDKALIDTSKDHGQLGDPVYLGAVDANTLTATGNYMVDTGTNTYENNWPIAISGRTPVRVLRSSNGIYQNIESSQFILTRRSIDFGNSWENWVLVNYYVGGATHIYLSKNGDNNSFGLTPEAPVLSVNRAIGVANAINAGSRLNVIYFHFGAGNWGDITFTSFPYLISITPYDGNNGTAYSEELPKFGTLKFNDSNFSVTGCVASLLHVNDKSIGSVIGYNRINSYASNYSSFLCVYSSVLEIGQYTSTTSPVISASTGGFIYFVQNANTTFRLVEDVTAYAFIRVNGTGHLYSLSNFTFDSNGHTFTGHKVKFSSGSLVTYGGTDPNTYFNNFFGSDLVFENGAILNGVSTGNVSKAGDTMTGDLIFSNKKVEIRTSAYAREENVTTTKNTPLLFGRDKNGSMIATITHYLDSNGVNSLKLSTYRGVSSSSDNASLIMYCESDGTGYIKIPEPTLASNDTKAVNAHWVNQKLGTGASVAALSALDRTDPDYVETLEIKKLDAVAQVNADAQQAIYMGFPYEIDGEEYRIGYGYLDQCNINGDAIVAMQNPGKTMYFRCMDDTGQTVWLDIPAETVLAIQKYGIVSHRDVIRKEADEKKARIMAATTEQEIQTIVME